MEGPVTGAGEVLGSWELVRVELIGKPSEGQPLPFGGDPHGVLHYLPDGRMAVLIQEARRPQIAGGRHGGSDAEWREAARKFTAYAGRYSIVPGRIVHHVEFNSFPNEVGVDYPRIACMEGGCLIVETPPDLSADQRQMRLVWQRFAALA